MSSWDVIAAALEASFRVVCCDFRGQLLSPGEPPATLDGHVRDVVQLLEALDLPAAHLVGTSFGGEVALLLAATHPARVLSLTVIGSTDHVTPEMWEVTRALLKAAEDAAVGGDGGRVHDLILPQAFSPAYLAAQGPALVARRAQIAALPRAWFTGLAGLLRSLHGLDLRAHLPAIRCPTLIIGAEGDETFPLACSRALADGIAGAQLLAVPDAGHAVVAERPARIGEMVMEFLESWRRS
jgi:3-oxoadipate enol-lactonase